MGVAERSSAYSHLVPRSGSRAQRRIEQKKKKSGCGPVGRALDLGDLLYLFDGSPSNPNIRCGTSTFPFCIFIKKGQNCGLTTVLTTTVRISFSASNSISGCGPVGRALDLGSRCREFESPHSDQKPESALQVLAFSLFMACNILYQ